MRSSATLASIRFGIQLQHLSSQVFCRSTGQSAPALAQRTEKLKELIGLSVHDCRLGERIYYGDCFDGKD